jgi:hypothetical protein
MSEEKHAPVSEPRALYFAFSSWNGNFDEKSLRSLLLPQYYNADCDLQGFDLSEEEFGSLGGEERTNVSHSATVCVQSMRNVMNWVLKQEQNPKPYPLNVEELQDLKKILQNLATELAKGKHLLILRMGGKAVLERLGSAVTHESA